LAVLICRSLPNLIFMSRLACYRGLTLTFGRPFRQFCPPVEIMGLKAGFPSLLPKRYSSSQIGGLEN
jgi:hypothetical protein